MRKHLLPTIVLILAVVITGSGQQPPTFPARVDLVTVDVLVFDRDGNPVRDLRPENFTIQEDGARQKVAAFEAISLQESPSTPARRVRVSTNDQQPDAAGRWFFVVFDDVNITQFATPRARDTLKQFIERALRTGDHIMIASSSGGLSWTGELPQDREALVQFVQKLQGMRRMENTPDRIWDHEAMAITLRTDPQAQAQVARRYFENDIIVEAGAAPADPGLRREVDVSPGIALIQTKARQTYMEARGRIQVSLGALDRISAALASARGRKSLLFFSEGFIADTTLPDFRRLVQTARNANVAVHFVDVRSPEGSLGQPGLPGAGADTARAVEDRDATTALALASRDADGTRSVATDTGGSTITGTNLLGGLTRVANEGRSYYLLGYSSTNSRRDGAFRKITVTVDRPGVTVRARGGYYAPSDKEPKPSGEKLDPAVRAGLDSPLGVSGIPLRLASYVFGAGPDGKVQTLLLAEADPGPLQLRPRDGRYSGVLESYVLIGHRETGELERDERLVELNMPVEVFEQARRTGVPIRREFSLRPGRYFATLLLRDRASGIVGSVRHEFDVPWPNDLRITTPIVTDTLQSAAPGQPGRPVPIARRTFKAGSRLFCVFDVVGAARDDRADGPRVSLTYRLRRVADGAEVIAVPAGQLPPGTVTIALTLPADAVGDHELQLALRDDVTKRTVEDVELLTIENR
jgi:VWFA-related protein